MNTIICFSFSDERVGNMVFIASSSDAILRLRSQLSMVVRATWSNPSNHGSRIVATVLDNPALRNEWLVKITRMTLLFLPF